MNQLAVQTDGLSSAWRTELGQKGRAGGPSHTAERLLGGLEDSREHLSLSPPSQVHSFTGFAQHQAGTPHLSLT